MNRRRAFSLDSGISADADAETEGNYCGCIYCNPAVVYNIKLNKVENFIISPTSKKIFEFPIPASLKVCKHNNEPVEMTEEQEMIKTLLNNVINNEKT